MPKVTIGEHTLGRLRCSEFRGLSASLVSLQDSRVSAKAIAREHTYIYMAHHK